MPDRACMSIYVCIFWINFMIDIYFSSDNYVLVLDMYDIFETTMTYIGDLQQPRTWSRGRVGCEDTRTKSNYWMRSQSLITRKVLCQGRNWILNRFWEQNRTTGRCRSVILFMKYLTLLHEMSYFCTIPTNRYPSILSISVMCLQCPKPRIYCFSRWQYLISIYYFLVRLIILHSLITLGWSGTWL